MSSQTLGWIKIHRKILENSFCKGNCEKLGFWTIIILLANHQENSFFIENQKITVLPGQFITGRKKLSEVSGVSEMKVERWLSCLESEQQIAQQKTNKFRLITVKKWKEYQLDEQQNAQQMNNKRTTDEQQMNTNKNDKKEKNDNTVADATDSLILNQTIMDEIEYIPLEEKPTKSRYGKSTMLLLAKSYLQTRGVQLSAGEVYDANKISRSLSKLYNETNKDVDETIRRLWLGSEYYKMKSIDWSPEAIWRNWELIEQWQKDGKPNEKQQRDINKKINNLDNNPLYE